MLIRDIMINQPVFVSPDALLCEVIEIMTNKDIGFMVIAEHKKALGVLTEGDLISLASQNIDMRSTLAGTHMNSPAFSVQADANVFHAYDELVLRKMRHLVVENESGDLVGVVTMSSFIANLGVEHFSKLQTVSDILIKVQMTVSQEMLIVEAIQLMNACKHAIIILDKDKPVGILTSRSITHLFRQPSVEWETLSVREVMKVPVTIHCKAFVPEASILMKHNHTRHLVVVGDNNAFMGLVTITDVAHSMEGRYVEFMRSVMQDMEEDLLAAGSQYRALFERNPNAVFSLDTNGLITHLNSAAILLTGFTSDFLFGKAIAELYDDECKSEGIKAFDLAKQGDAQSVHIRMNAIDDRTIHVFMSVVPIMVEGNLVGVYAVAFDITERVLAELRLEALSQELHQTASKAQEASVSKSEFLATMSHEIRTPLNGVLGLTELVLKTDLTEMQRFNLNTVKSSGEALLTILNDILDFSKIEAGKLEIKCVEFNPNEVIEHVVNIFGSNIDEDEATLELIARSIPNLPNLLMGDSDRLQQVMMNLLSNAVKFTEEGEILIAVDLVSETDSDAVIRFTVKDTGKGISESNQKELFEEFTQADGTDTRKHGGTGLGLSIVKNLVALMGGEITVASEMGRGSSFFFELHLQKASSIKDGPHHYHSQFSQWRGLVVDDRSTMRNKLHDALHAWGMQMKACSSGRSAMQELRNKAATGEAYDLITIDQQMEGMDGMALARLIKETPELSKLKVIMTTSLDMTFDAHLCEQYGLDGFMRKPIYLSSLFETILSVMGIRERQKKNSEGHRAGQREEKILLAEDNLVNQQVALGMLAHQGFNSVDLAHNGVEAIKYFVEYNYDLVLMDVQMPELDGISATREIREIELKMGGDTHVPIIALTAHALTEDRQRTSEAGMDGHLTKPLTGASLHEILTEWLPAADETIESAPLGPELQAASDSSLIDKVALCQMREDIGFGIGMILDAYLDELPKNIEAIEAAITNNDGATLKSHGHRLKGASRSVSATLFAEKCSQLETSGENSDLKTAANILVDFKEMAKELNIALNADWVNEIR